jgi:hypothetical protein
MAQETGIRIIDSKVENQLPALCTLKFDPDPLRSRFRTLR